MNAPPSQPIPGTPVWATLLPRALQELPLARLGLPAAAVAAFAQRSLLTVRNVFACDPAALRAPDLLPHVPLLQQAFASAVQDGFVRHAAVCEDWPAFRAQLVGGLTADEADVLARLVGFEAPPIGRLALAHHLRVSPARLDDLVEHVRNRVGTTASALVGRLQAEATSDLAAFDGALPLAAATPGTLLHRLAERAPDPELGLRLLAFLLPHAFSHHRATLLGIGPHGLRKLLRALPPLVAPQRLPLHLDWIRDELGPLGEPVPRGTLLHVLRTELRVAIEHDPVHGEVVVPDPRTPEARLVELLQEAGRPLRIADLLFAYRERFRAGSLAGTARRLRRSDVFVQVGVEHWALRSDHQAELAGTRALADRIARRIVTEGGRHHVADLLAADERDARTEYYVLDHLAHDPRVRMLGRGDACAASHRRSAVLETLLADFRRAAGEVVVSRFLGNQPPGRRRLVERLLRENRLFVQPAPDRIDTISNWPFNEERLQRLLALATSHLRRRAGYAHGDALRAVVARSDVGGDWLTTPLLLDVLRRHGPLELLPGGIVALADTALASTLLRSVRSVLRAAGVPLTVDDIVRARPELGEFAAILAELLTGSPLVQTPDGVRFALA